VKRTIASIATALGLAVAISACSGDNGSPRSHRTIPPSPSPSPSWSGPPNAELGRSGLISMLPDTCPADKASLPNELSGAHLFDGYEAPIENTQVCEWSVLENSHARILRYLFRQLSSLAEAHKEFSARKRSNGGTCRYSKSAIDEQTNLGDEAFAVPCRAMKERITEGPHEDHMYEVGGLELDYRIRNVVVSFFWLGADYPTSVATKNPQWLRGGKELSYEQSLPQAIKVAQSTLTHFPR
jgi:hypothetical protein